MDQEEGNQDDDEGGSGRSRSKDGSQEAQSRYRYLLLGFEAKLWEMAHKQGDEEGVLVHEETKRLLGLCVVYSTGYFEIQPARAPS